MSKIASTILRMFVSDVSAGACVPDHGCCCKPPHAKHGAVNCFGACVHATSCRPNCPPPI